LVLAGVAASVASLLSACTFTPQPPVPTYVVRGVLLDVVAPSIQKIDSFTLRSDDGEELHFVAAPNFNQGVAHQMTPGHMRQHMALADPILVTYTKEPDGTLVALNAADVTQ
jgi:hypothetical protein